MIFENQFSVGDYIKIDDVEGTVEATAMRVTYLRSAKGDQIIIPNGSITRVINYNKGNAVASVTLPISYEADTAKVLDLIDLAVTEYARQHPDLTEEKPQVLGVTAMKESNMEVNITCKVKPMKQWAVGARHPPGGQGDVRPQRCALSLSAGGDGAAREAGGAGQPGGYLCRAGQQGKNAGKGAGQTLALGRGGPGRTGGLMERPSVPLFCAKSFIALPSGR